MKKPNILLALSLPVCALLMTACTSKLEQEARRDNAFDLSGSYKTQSTSEVPLTFDVVNQSGRHDIMIRAYRLGALSPKEANFLTSKGLDANAVSRHYGSKIEMGRGDDRHNLDGGDNISDD